MIQQGGLERVRASICRCIVEANLSVLKLVVVRQGEKDIPGQTDAIVL